MTSTDVTTIMIVYMSFTCEEVLAKIKNIKMKFFSLWERFFFLIFACGEINIFSSYLKCLFSRKEMFLFHCIKNCIQIQISKFTGIIREWVDVMSMTLIKTESKIVRASKHFEEHHKIYLKT